MAEFRKALQINPGYIYPYVNMANHLFSPRKTTRRHLPNTKKPCKSNPGDADSHFYCGLALDKLGRFDEAIAEYRKALQIDPRLYHRLLQYRNHFFLPRTP